MTTLKPLMDETVARLTTVGAPFEMHAVQVNGQQLRAYRHALPDLQALLLQARSHGAKPFVESDGRTWSFDDLFAQADALAARWQHETSLHAGDRVAIALRNLPEWAVAWAAAVLCGAVPAALNSFGQRDELIANLAELKPRVLVCDDERAQRVQGAHVLQDVKLLQLGSAEWQRLTAPGAPPLHTQPVQPDDAALVLYTSGAGSRAKGVVSSHRAVCQALFNIDFIGAFSAATSPQALQRLMARGLPPTTLTAVPLFHVSGLHAQLLTALRHGRRLVFMRRYEPAAALALMRQYRVTQFNGAPAMVMQLLAEPGFDDAAAHTLGGLGFGGAGLPQRLIEEVHARMPGSMSGIGFGMTETNGVGAAASGTVFERHPSASGLPSPIIDLRICDPGGQPLAPGERGEICLRGVSLMQGYWGQPQATAEAFRDGWLRTGDIGYLCDQGLLHVVDRIKDVINRSGEKVAAAEVESCLLMCPQVLEAAVFGIPDETTDEAIVAQVVVSAEHAAQPDTLRTQLAAHLAAHLAAYKTPAHWHISAMALPRNPAGKLLKSKLRAAWLQQAAACGPGVSR